MRFGDRLEIVRLVGMGAHGVGEGGVDRGGAQIRGHDGGLIDAAEAADDRRSRILR